MSAPRVLVVEDDTPLRESLAQWLSLNDFDVQQASGGKEAQKLLATGLPDVVISDVRMRGMTGLELLDYIKTHWPELPVLILSGHGDVPMAVAAMQAGAFTFLTKPYVPEQLVGMLRSAVEQSRLRERVVELERRSEAGSVIDRRLIGSDASMQELKALVARLAGYPVDVLIRGETGTGKEVVARLLHDCSPRRDAPYVALNCAALPADIIEAELFGHESGAFTGASGQRVGKFEFANGGTVFLDEIESMPLAAQGKLLRVLQERSVTRLGSNKEIAIDIRVLSASKESLPALAESGKFRGDLYYRLMGAELTLPPLRERGHDAVLLFDHFMRAMASGASLSPPPLSASETAAILAYPWPGNVRELKLLAERRALDLPWRPDANSAARDDDRPLAEIVDAFELSVIEAAMTAAEGRSAQAAEKLQVPVRTLNEKLKRLTGRVG